MQKVACYAEFDNIPIYQIQPVFFGNSSFVYLDQTSSGIITRNKSDTANTSNQGNANL